MMRRLSLALLVALGWAGPLWAQGPQSAQSYPAGASMECTYSTTAVAAVCTRDAIDYRSVSVHIVTQGGSSTVTWQVSNDNVTWVGTTLIPSTAAGTSSPAPSTTTAGIWHGPLTGRYFRLNVTGIASGTTAGVVEFSAMPAAELASPISVTAITSTVTPGTSATHLGKAEDAGHTTADTGVFVLGVRNDGSGTQTTSANTDYSQLSTDAYGAQWVRNGHPNAINCIVTVSTATTIQAVGGSCIAPGASLSIYITDVTFDASATGIAADAFPTLKSGTTGTCGTGTAVIWQALSAAAVTIRDHFTTPIKVAANSEVCWISSTAGSKTISINGFIAP